MADDKRDGEDLFEDLDKFFAPIKDVDWDEPAATGARETPSEEHVSLRSDEPQEAGPVEPEPGPMSATDGGSIDQGHDEEHDEDWYDTTVLDTIDGIAVDQVDDEITVPESPETGGSTGSEEDDVVSLEDLAMSQAPIAEETPGQEGLFTGSEPEADDEPEDGWALVASGEDDVQKDVQEEDAPEVGVEIETAPMSTIEEEIVVTNPSDEELEAAAEHFAGSVRGEAGLETDPDEEIGGLVGFGEDEGVDQVQAEAEDPFAEHVPQDQTLAEAAMAGDDVLSDLHPDDGPQTVVVGNEGLGGPSWQEPASVEVGADAERRGPGAGERDVPAAFLTGVVLVGVALAALLIGKGVFGVIAGAVVLLAQGELFGVMVKHHRQPATAVGLIAGVLMLAGAYFDGEGAVLAMFALGVIATFLWFMSGPSATRKDTAVNIGLTVLNMAWIPLLGSYLFVMLDGPDGTELVLAVIGLTFVYDTAAFLSGSVWGGQFFQRPLAPSVSPKKSMEGLIIGGLITVIVSVTLVTSFVDLFQEERIDALLLGIVVAAAATFGDLAESLIKRDVGIKDMSSLLPGHGGVLDRIDSLLFVAPASFLLFRVFFA